MHLRLRLARVCVACVLCAVSGCMEDTGELKAELDASRERAEELQSELQALSALVQEKQDALDQLQRDAEDQEGALGQLQQDADAQQAALDELQSTLADAEDEIARKEKDLAEERARQRELEAETGGLERDLRDARNDIAQLTAPVSPPVVLSGVDVQVLDRSASHVEYAYIVTARNLSTERQLVGVVALLFVDDAGFLRGRSRLSAGVYVERGAEVVLRDQESLRDSLWPGIAEDFDTLQMEVEIDGFVFAAGVWEFRQFLVDLDIVVSDAGGEQWWYDSNGTVAHRLRQDDNLWLESAGSYVLARSGKRRRLQRKVPFHGPQSR